MKIKVNCTEVLLTKCGKISEQLCNGPGVFVFTKGEIPKDETGSVLMLVVIGLSFKAVLLAAYLVYLKCFQRRPTSMSSPVYVNETCGESFCTDVLLQAQTYTAIFKKYF